MDIKIDVNEMQNYEKRMMVILTVTKRIRVMMKGRMFMKIKGTKLMAANQTRISAIEISEKTNGRVFSGKTKVRDTFEDENMRDRLMIFDAEVVKTSQEALKSSRQST
ncbi:hypothetical protein Tco_0185187 [Tanacetum coccineum]